MRKGTETVTEITKMFTERALLYPEFVSFKEAQMTRYLSMLKTNILQFVSTQCYGTLTKLHGAATRLDIEFELQSMELRWAHV